VENIDFLKSGFCCRKFKQIAKIGFGREKNSIEPSMCSHLGQW
jgi:hypothetical protein